MLRLYLNHHVNLAIAAGLRVRGVDLVTCQDDGTEAWDDNQILDRARNLGRVVFTQDEDFLAIASHRQRLGVEFAGVAYAHQLGISVGKAVQDLELLSKVYDAEDMRNRVEYLPYS